jgi:DNA-binding MarR family transcriptional regulator
MDDGERLADLLERVGSLLRAERRGVAAAAGLQPGHLDVLRYLARCNRYSDTPGAVVEYLGLTKGTVSQSLLLLERRGLLEKVADPRDGRVVRLRLTPRGRAVARRSRSPIWERVRQALPPGERAALAERLEQVLRGMQAAGGYRSFGLCRSCRFLQQTGAGVQCGLTGEALTPAETERICREHEAA